VKFLDKVLDGASAHLQINVIAEASAVVTRPDKPLILVGAFIGARTPRGTEMILAIIQAFR
jgi:hypothetical protein